MENRIPDLLTAYKKYIFAVKQLFYRTKYMPMPSRGIVLPHATIHHRGLFSTVTLKILIWNKGRNNLFHLPKDFLVNEGRMRNAVIPTAGPRKSQDGHEGNSVVLPLQFLRTLPLQLLLVRNLPEEIRLLRLKGRRMKNQSRLVRIK